MKLSLLGWLGVWVSLTAFSQNLPSNVYAYHQVSVVNHPGYQERTLLEGTTRDYSHLLVQAITLSPNQPQQPVQQLEEEAVLIIKTGELTLTLGSKRKTLQAGSLAIVMPGDEYRIDNKASQPLTYYLVRYTSNEMPDLDLTRLAGGSYWVDGQQMASATDHPESPQQSDVYPSVMSNRISMHVTKLPPRTGPPKSHTHRAAELIFILGHSVQASINGVQKVAQEGDLLFFESEVAHDIQTNDREGSTYFAFQF